MANTRASGPNRLSISTDEEDGQHNSEPPPPDPRLSIDQGETRHISVSEVVGLDFHSFIPQADITSQVHFFSGIQADSPAGIAGLTDGDRILQINGVNVTNLEHEDVRKLMQLMTPIVFTVAHDPKYLLLLQEPVSDIEEKQPEPPVTSTEDDDVDPLIRQVSRFELARPSVYNSAESAPAGLDIARTRRCELFDLNQPDETSNEEPLKAKLCHLRRSKTYDGYGLVLVSQQNLHVIGQVEKSSPSYRAGLRENDVILFVGKTNVERLVHDEVKLMIRAMTLASNQVDLTVLSKLDIPKYKTLFEKGLIDWSIMGLEK